MSANKKLTRYLITLWGFTVQDPLDIDHQTHIMVVDAASLEFRDGHLIFRDAHDAIVRICASGTWAFVATLAQCSQNYQDIYWVAS